VKFITFLLIFLTLPAVFAQTIRVGVKMELKGNITAFSYNASNGILAINSEFYNSGSVPYRARARLDIVNSSDIIFTGWSKEELLMPGERKNFELFYYTDESLENITAIVRIYYGFEVAERKIELKLENLKTPEDIFQIKNFRTYDSYVKFQLRSNKPLRNVLVIPRNYMMGWAFEEKRIENLEANKNVEIVLPYEAPVWLPQNITIDIVTEDGNYHSAAQFLLQKEAGIMKYIHYLTDKLILLLNA